MAEIKRLSQGVFIVDDYDTALNFLKEGVKSNEIRVIAIITNEADMDSILDLGLSYITNGSTIKKMFAPKTSVTTQGETK